MSVPQRNALEASFEAAQTLSDKASDALNLLDIWSRRQPLQLQPGQVQEMYTILREAHNALAEAKEAFSAALAGERLLRPLAAA